MYSVERNTCESLGELEKAVEILFLNNNAFVSHCMAHHHVMHRVMDTRWQTWD